MRVLFDLPSGFFDSCPSSLPSTARPRRRRCGFRRPTMARRAATRSAPGMRGSAVRVRAGRAMHASKNSSRSHFKSDLHKLNVKLNLTGRRIVTEEEFDEKLISESLLEDCDLSCISGSEDELEDCNTSQIGGASEKGDCIAKRKLFFHLNSGDLVPLWKCLIHGEHEDHSNNFYFNKIAVHINIEEMVDRLRSLICEPRDKTRLRIVLLASGGHFTSCVFDGGSVVAHGTFHRYVVRANAGN